MTNQPMLRATAPIVRQDFDAIGEIELTIGSSRHCPSLDNYDHATHEDAEDYLYAVVLERWGDRRLTKRD